MIKTCITFTILLFAIQIKAQPPGGGSFQSAELKAENMAEILILENETVIKKGKVSDSLKKITDKLTNHYNRKMDSIYFANTSTFNQCNEEMKKTRSEAMQNRNIQLMQRKMQEINVILGPILKEVRIIRNNYFDSLRASLDDKSYKKIVRYVSNKVQALKPQIPSGSAPRPSGAGGF